MSDVLADRWKIAGFVPAYNSESTVGEAVRSLREQAPRELEVLVIDDKSTDDTARMAEAAGARVVTLAKNSGRGAVRAKAVEMMEVDLIVSLDAGNRVASDFLARALPYFDDPKVGAVVGHWDEPSTGGIARRWRARHLYKVDRQPEEGQSRYLATHGCVLRKSAVLETGNFSVKLRHTEDASLGWLMMKAGWKIIAGAACRVESQKPDNLPSLAKRYWRWHAGHREAWSLARYFGSVKNSLCVMAPLDWRAGDYGSLMFTLLIPHWIALYTVCRKLTRSTQK